MNNRHKNKLLAFSLIELSIVVLIIGILIAGVTQGSRLVRQSRIKVAQNLTISSPVPAIPNLTVWFEPVLDTSILSASNGQNPENGDLISGWNDNNPQVLNKINLTQSVSVDQPTYVANGINRLPTLSFTSAGSTYLANTTIGPISVNNTRYSIAVVIQTRNSGASDWQQIISQGGCLVGGDMAGLDLNPVGNVGPSGTVCGSEYSPNSYVVNKTYIMISVVNGQSVNLYTNSNTASIGTFTTKTNLGPNVSSLYVGARVGFTSDTFDGYISEIIIYDRVLKKSEITDINSYLSKKYAIKLN